MPWNKSRGLPWGSPWDAIATWRPSGSLTSSSLEAKPRVSGRPVPERLILRIPRIALAAATDSRAKLAPGLSSATLPVLLGIRPSTHHSLAPPLALPLHVSAYTRSGAGYICYIGWQSLVGHRERPRSLSPYCYLVRLRPDPVSSQLPARPIERSAAPRRFVR